MNEKLYREALELIYRHIECYGRAINPSIEDMRYSWQLIHDLVYSSIYYTPTGNKIKHPQLQAMEYHSRQMFVWFTKRDAGANVCSIDLSNFPDIRSSMNRVNDRILEFIKEYDQKN